MRRKTMHRGVISLSLLALAALTISSYRTATATSSAREIAAAGAYAANFTGVGAEGEDIVWIGPATGSVYGEMTIRVAHDGSAMDMNQPTWSVKAIIFVSGRPEESFAAEVEGMIDWRKGRMELHGPITVGYMKGASFEQTARIDDLDMKGEWRIVRSVASR
jgi:hypothetical protein